MTWIDFLRGKRHRTRTSRCKQGVFPTAADSLEVRLLLTAPTMTDSEQYMLELLNRARANPSAEAARYGIGLNDGLPAGTISTAAKQPLAPQQQLIAAARLHSQDMLDRDYFDHVTLGAGTTFRQRITNQGYTGFAGENIAVAAKQVNASETVFVDESHRGLILSAGHRDNVLFPDFEEVGIGAKIGSYVDRGSTFPFTLMVTQNFGSRNQNPFLTGVVYTDANSNRFYTIGESIRSGTVTAVNVSTGATYSDTIGVSGAYGFVVPAGTYSVTAAVTLNGVLKTFGKSTASVVSTSNVKVDFETNSDPLVPAPVAPVVDLNGAASGTGVTTNYTSGAGAVAIVAPDTTVTDADSSNLFSATITLSNPASTESLSITGAPTAITVTAYNRTTGVLKLTGNASLANYQTAFRALRYSDTASSAAGNRTITVTVNDGTKDSNPVTATITRNSASVVGDMDGDGQVTTQDGNLITLILLGASDGTIEGLRTTGSTATAAQIRASFESRRTLLDVDHNGATTTQDGNLVVLVALGASDSILELLRGPANTPDTRNTAAQIKTAVQSLRAGSAAPASDSTNAFAMQEFSSPSPVKWSGVLSDSFPTEVVSADVVVLEPESERLLQSERNAVARAQIAGTLSQPVGSEGFTNRTHDQIDLLFESLLDEKLLLSAF